MMGNVNFRMRSAIRIHEAVACECIWHEAHKNLKNPVITNKD
jgi:hypothetical protein